MKQLILLLAALITFSHAKTYETVTYEGLVHLSELSAAEITAIEAGKELSEADIDTAIKKLFEQGYFADIWVEEKNAALIFNFKEKPVISSIDFKGASETEKEDKLKPLLSLKKGEIFHEERLEGTKQRIIESMRNEGYFDTVVEAKVESSGDESVSIEFEINKGENIIITRQDFDGTQKFGQGDIENDLANKEAQFAGWFIGRSDGKLKLDQLDYDSQRVKNFYMKNGYLDAQVSDPLLSVDFDQYAANIFYSIEEGGEYRVGTIEIKLMEGNASLEGAEEQLKLKSGRIFNIEKMRKDLQAIQDVVGAQGYAFARVYPDIKKNKETHIADITYAVSPGKQVYIRDVIIAGNSRTLDRVVRREIFLAPGDLYSTVEMRESRNSLGRLGFFKTTKIDEKRVGDDQMDLVVRVEETHTASLTVGGGYGNLNGWSVNAAISDRNVFGSAMNLSLNFEKSQLTNRTEFSILNPRVNDSAYSLGTSFSITDVDYSNIGSTNNQKSKTKAVTVQSGKRLSRYWNASTSISHSQSEITYSDVNTTLYPYLYNVDTTKTSLTPYIAFDNTDDYFTPRSGMTFSDSVEFTGFGSDQKFTQENLRFAYYFGLDDWINYDMILRYRFRGAYVFADVDDYILYPDYSRLRMGGVRSVRGFRTGSISPVQRNSDGSVYYYFGQPRYLGGNQMVVNNLEINIPLVPQSGLRMSFFYDHGMIGLDDFSEERKSYGVSFDWITPMAPLQFVFGWPVETKSYDETASFEFTMGQRF